MISALNRTDRAFLLLFIFGALLLLFRFFFFYPTDWRLLLDEGVHLRGPTTLFFLGWNLFLAGLPYLFSRLLSPRSATPQNLILLLLWLLFLPNAPYLVSDFIHLRPRPGVPFTLDVLVFVGFALTGLSLAGASVQNVMNKHNWSTWSSGEKAASLLLFPAVGFGIFLGRVLRWNSWDALYHPEAILADLTRSVAEPDLCYRMLAYTFGYGVLLAVVTWTFSFSAIRRSPVKRKQHDEAHLKNQT